MAFFTAVDAPTKRRGLLRLALRVGGRPVLRACVKGAGGAWLSPVDIGLNWCDQKMLIRANWRDSGSLYSICLIGLILIYGLYSFIFCIGITNSESVGCAVSVGLLPVGGRVLGIKKASSACCTSARSYGFRSVTLTCVQQSPFQRRSPDRRRSGSSTCRTRGGWP